ncbi:MAG: LPS export ABC transporter permease LptG [Wenzhouxiangellaceae bacterium]|nr:LPS export ABC transporter permease LptG [Wenzhouxiangellaceae bacterium]
MLPRLWRYLAREQLRAVMATLAVLLGLYLGIDLVGEVRDMRAGYGLLQVMMYVLATAPARIYDLFPFALLIGSSLALARLASGSELVAMRACGFHRSRLLRALLSVALLLGVVVMQVGEWLAPGLELDARIERERALDNQLGRGSGQSLWVRDGQRIIHVAWLSWAQGLDERIRFDDLTLYQLDGNGDIEGWIRADSAEHWPGQWQLSQARVRTIGTGDRAEVQSLMVLESSLDPGLFRALATRPRLMSLRDIARIRSWLASNGQATVEFDQAFWRRLLYPFNLLAMVFAGMAMMLALSRSVPPGLGVFSGVALGVGFLLVQRLVLGLAPIVPGPLFVLHLLPLVVFLLIGWLLLRR